LGKLFAVVRLASIAIAAGAVFMLLRVPEPPPQEAVRQVFAAYKRAVLADDGTTAAALLSAATIDWYGKTQDLALHATKEEIERLGPLEKIQVLAFRQRVPAEELRAMSPRQLVAYSVSRGWIGKTATQHSKLGPVTPSGDGASAELLLSGKATGQKYYFTREDGQWRFNQLPTLQGGDEGLKLAAAQRGMTVDQFVQLLVESASGKKITTDVWTPPFPRETPAGVK
jgi:hypothetical protein